MKACLALSKPNPCGCPIRLLHPILFPRGSWSSGPTPNPPLAALGSALQKSRISVTPYLIVLFVSMGSLLRYIVNFSAHLSWLTFCFWGLNLTRFAAWFQAPSFGRLEWNTRASLVSVMQFCLAKVRVPPRGGDFNFTECACREEHLALWKRKSWTCGANLPRPDPNSPKRNRLFVCGDFNARILALPFPADGTRRRCARLV